tara:strand:- start:88 stop:1299 length:1212 start_codon:yes stop_codon:yes gene_type:complete
MNRSPIVVLDIGASNIICLVGEQLEDRVKTLGMGKSPCAGLRRSSIIDMPKLVDAIRHAVNQAEKTAGVQISGAYFGIAGEAISTATSHSAVAISGMSNPISDDDVRRALEQAEHAAPNTDGTVLHRFVQSYAVDGELVQNPLWLHGNKLEIETLSIAASNQICTTLQRAAQEAGIDSAGFILETVGTAAAVIGLDEREMGVGLLDLGAGTTDLAIFSGPLRHVVEIPFGGKDITNDLSVVLNISPSEAERLKVEHGCVRCPAERAEEMVPFTTTAGRQCHIPRQQLSEIIEARQHEIFEFVFKELERNHYGQMLAAGMVLTGGGAQLENIVQLGEDILGLPVRHGVPEHISPIDDLQTPQYATAIGLLHFAMDEQFDTADYLQSAVNEKGLLDRITKIFSFL